MRVVLYLIHVVVILVPLIQSRTFGAVDKHSSHSYTRYANIPSLRFLLVLYFDGESLRASSLDDARDTFVGDQTTFDRARFSARPIGDSLVPLGSCSQLFELRNSVLLYVVRGRFRQLPGVYLYASVCSRSFLDFDQAIAFGRAIFFSPIRNQFRPGFTVSLYRAHSLIYFGSSELRRFSFHHDLSFVSLCAV